MYECIIMAKRRVLVDSLSHSPHVPKRTVTQLELTSICCAFYETIDVKLETPRLDGGGMLIHETITGT